MLEDFSWFILVPIWVSILIMGARFLGIGFSKRNTVLMSILSTLISAIYCGYALFYTYNNSPVEVSYNFLSIRELNFTVGVYVDMLNSLIGLAVSIITFIIYIYSAFYMDKEKSFSRFYSLMNIFNSTILGYIFSPNLFQMLIFWELIGAVSYLLIGFWYNKAKVSIDAKRVFLINAIGDVLLFLGFVIVSMNVTDLLNDMSLVSLPFANLNLIVSSFYASTTPEIYSFVSLLFVFAAIVKSAQFPINSWLINAMSAPTPVSALIHSSTLVMTGIFLLMRIFPLVASDILSLKIMIVLGSVTAFLTSFSALLQTNIKKVLAYSTSSQLGLVLVALALYNPIASIVYLVSHAFIKALLFMCAGVVIKIVKSKNILFMGKFRECSPIVALSFIVGAIALSGLGFSGFNAKSLLANVFANTFYLNFLFAIIGALTSLYIFRLYFLVFENKAGYECSDLENYNNPKYNIAYGTLIFMSLAIILSSFIIPNGHFSVLYLLNLFMGVLAYYLYNFRNNLKLNTTLYQIIVNGFYINKIYYWGEIYLYKFFTKLVSLFDTYILGGLESLVRNLMLSLAKVAHQLQVNNFQCYICYGVWCLLFVICIFIGLYSVILNIFGV